ncbi:cation:proton antiporter [Euzebya tangerina]|uniref:cation:proton antiporter n=1 Tax=Euzebya tangerina TaxID=591198 RepID=UPI000E30C0CC|nr:cation:proton antiporter [Euzebya tangerina]
MELHLLPLLSVLAAAWVAGAVATRLGYPAILGELLIGIVAGPAALGLLQPDESLTVLAELGVLLMMLYIGLEIDLSDLRRASTPGLLAAAGGFIVPFVLGYLAVIAFGGEPIAGLFVGIAVGVTSLATKSRILVDLDLLDTRIAHVLMAGALLSDTATLLIFAGILGYVELGTVDAGGIGLVAVEAAIFFAFAAVAGWKVIPWMGTVIRRYAADAKSLHFLVVVAIGLVFAEAAELAGLHAILGAFIAGLVITDTTFSQRPMRHTETVLQDISIRLLAPIFFVTAGFEVSFDVFRTDLALLLTVMVVAFAGKILGTALFYLPSGRGWREGITVGAGMNGRGAVEIVVAGIGLEAGIITTEIFSILVFMAITTTATVPLFLTWGVEWLRRNGELEKGSSRRRGAIVIGAGPTGRLVAGLLPGPVTLLDGNQYRCRRAKRQGFRVINGDALDEEVLRLAGAADVRELVAVTPNAEVNVLAAQLARDLFGMPETKVLLPSSASPAMARIVKNLDAGRLFGNGTDIEAWDQHLVDERATTVTVSASDVNRRDGSTLVLAVVREGETILFVEGMELQEADEVVMLNKTGGGEVLPVPM